MALFTMASMASAQTAFSGTTTNPNRFMYNTTVDTANLTLSAVNKTVIVTAFIHKHSGTMAGTVRLYGSNYRDSTGSWIAVGDTMTLTDASAGHQWVVSPCGYKYLRLLHSGGTTLTGTLNATAIAFKD